MEKSNFTTKKNLRIFIGRHYDLDTKNNTHLIIDNLLPILNQKYSVSLIWFFSMSEKQKINSTNSETFLDIRDYDNAVDVLKEIKPDLIFDNDFPSLMDFAIDIAAKHLDIPVVSKIISTDREKTNLKQFFFSFIPMFFHSTLPSEKTGKKKFMKRGRSFSYRYWFLLKTLKASNFSILKILQYFFIILKWHFSAEIPYLNPRFQNKLQFLENENMLKLMIKKGYDSSTLFVTGNPIYDNAFLKFRNNNKKINCNSEKIRILFAPIQLYEGGIWTKKQRDITIKQIITQLSTKNEKFSIIVKLHPSSQIYSEYQSLIHEINPEILIYQKGSIEDYLENVDVVVSFGTIYSSLIFALIAKKPLILCNFINFNPETPIEHLAAWECTNPSELLEIIEKASENNTQHQEDVDNYLKKLMYKTDGKSSERLVRAIRTVIGK